MAVRLVVTITAAPGKGSELAQANRACCEKCINEPGCEQFDAHAKLNASRPALRPELRVSSGEPGDYEYNRTC